MIAFSFALLFSVNSVFASYSDASGYYSCLGGGWNFTSSGVIYSPSSASGTYQLSVLNAFSFLGSRIRSAESLLTDIRTSLTGSGGIGANVISIKSDASLSRISISSIEYDVDSILSNVSSIDSSASVMSADISAIKNRLGYIYSRQLVFGERFFEDDFSVDTYPNSFATQLIDSVLDPTERQLRESTKGLVEDTFTEGGSFSPARIDTTRSSLSSLSDVPDLYISFFDAGGSPSYVIEAFNRDNLSFFSQAVYNDLNGITTRKSSSPAYVPDGDYIVGSREYYDTVKQFSYLLSGGDER